MLDSMTGDFVRWQGSYCMYIHILNARLKNGEAHDFENPNCRSRLAMYRRISGESGKQGGDCRGLVKGRCTIVHTNYEDDGAGELRR
jgi:hypothetical protein